MLLQTASHPTQSLSAHMSYMSLVRINYNHCTLARVMQAFATLQMQQISRLQRCHCHTAQQPAIPQVKDGLSTMPTLPAGQWPQHKANGMHHDRSVTIRRMQSYVLPAISWPSSYAKRSTMDSRVLRVERSLSRQWLKGLTLSS